MGKKFYITTPIYYVNASPHLGHAYTGVIADVLARYWRGQGTEVWFTTGTDEHGAKVARAAEKAGKDVGQFVSEVREVFKKLAGALNLSNDDFISTSDEKRHFPGARALWKKIEASGDIYKGTYEGLYCLGHEAFITEKDLMDGKCADHDEEPQVLKEENYFFRLSKYNQEIKRRIESGKLNILPEGRKNEILSLLNEGLKDVSFSRPSKDIPWGVPVPGDATQTMYVWCEALSSYISSLGFGGADESKFLKFWPADLHLVGKDILRFHAALWPAMLLSAALPLPKTIIVHGLIQVGGRKMSKTLGNIASPSGIIEVYGVDALRYYLSREIPIFGDGEFTEEKFRESYEANLVNGVGNYVSRVSAMARNYFGGAVEKPAEENIAGVPFREYASDFMKSEGRGEKLEYFSIPYVAERVIWPRYKEAMVSFETNKALDIVFEFMKKLDGYVEDYKPFNLIKEDKEKTQAILWCLCYGTVSLAKMLSPFMPETSEKIFGIFGVGADDSEWKNFKVSEHNPLFPRKEEVK